MFGLTTQIKRILNTFKTPPRRLNRRFRREGLIWENVLADSGYSSGENYEYFENKGLTTFLHTGPTKVDLKVSNTISR
ncbi:hypothetical protein APR41_05555 [Salegentibacter salinarum]|uniref:Transposase IS4-like domain-containing protein n=1 Tax=Salegentibacter salinarum TaxID=447422 RepID=A0A2N0TSH6_9FLAO|nr:hypothetical protein APR41_05555 [Salegentibacter salinarum]